MDHRSTEHASFATLATSIARAAANVLRFLLIGRVSRYQPAKYYMRGPGPKWHERHGIDPLSKD